jgi:hypothetical protein
MLGLARAAQYAGWGQIAPSFQSVTQSSMITGSSWVGLTSVQPNNWNSPNLNELAGVALDQTGIVSGNRATHVMTFRMKTASNFDFQSDGFTTGIEFLQPDEGVTQYSPFFVYINDSVRQFQGVVNPKLARHTASGDFVLMVDWGSYGSIRFNGITWDSLADRWITVMASVSATQSDFVNHNPPETFGGLYGRMTLVDAETEQLITTRDFRTNQFGDLITDAADREWRYRSSSGDDATAWLLSQIRGGTRLETDDILVAAGWASVNQMIDPGATVSGIPAWRWFVGQRFPETVSGVRAWVNFSSNSTSVESGVVSLTQFEPGRVSTTGNIWATNSDEFLSTPYLSSDRP